MAIVENQTAFKDCDIRGKYPDDVNESLFQSIGNTFGRKILKKRFDCLNNGTIVVGGDHRLSTPALKNSFLAGLARHSLKIIDLGIVSTPVVYWVKSKLKTQASAVITASHNPPEFNGLKIMNGDRPPTPEDIRNLAHADADDRPDILSPSGDMAAWPEAIQAYQEEIIDTFSSKGIDSLSIVIDPGNGCQAGIASNVFSRLGAMVTAIHNERDSLFTERHPDCAIPENLATLIFTVKNTRADLGIAFDGDGDRLAVVDNKGRIVGSERVGMILLQGPLQPRDRDSVILDVKCSMQLERIVSKLDGSPVRCKSGHAYMKAMVLDRQAMMGVELSGHIFLREIEGRDDPLYTALILGSYLAGKTQNLSDMVDRLPSIFMTPDVRIPMPSEEIDRLIEACSNGIEGARVEILDGVRLVWDEGWVLVRRSITEPKVTIRLEGESSEDLKTICQRFMAFRPELAPHIEAVVASVFNSV